MGSASVRPTFGSEAAWPFRLHLSQLARCQDFLTRSGPTPRLLRIFGRSGAGKSFLVRELMVEAASAKDRGIGLYVDVPPGELEASALLSRIDVLLSERRAPSRDAPSFVDKKCARSWIAAKRGTTLREPAYGYRATRDLTAQIPLVGPFIQAILPQASLSPVPSSDSTVALRFLMKRSRSKPVMLVLDNVQFLPFAVREILEIELAEAGPHLRLVMIERVQEARRLSWMPPLPGAENMDIELQNASVVEVGELVREVLPDADDVEDLSAAIFRRSDGNLKSVWFQLKLITSRRDEQQGAATSYEDVILTLSPLDQTVLRIVVFTIGGLTIATLASLLRATDLRAEPDAVTHAISDLASLGLLIVNGDHSDRVRVEHELVAQMVSEMTPEDEKLELRAQVVTALSAVLDEGATPEDQPILYDRLLGIVNDVELRQTPSLLAHVVEFIQIQSDLDRHRYLSSICRDSVCWDVLDSFPEVTIRSLLDAIQKSSLFSFGLVAAARLRRSSRLHESLASLYEAKYLVQLFRYDAATAALERADDSDDKRAVAFNIMLNLAQDDRAAEIASDVYADISRSTGSEHDYVILRNSAHLFPVDDARVLVDAAIEGFEAISRRFGVATALNNRGIVEIASGSIGAARAYFEESRRQLEELDSAEVYQPLVNLSALAVIEGDAPAAEMLLAAARDAAPRSLLQDGAMLDLNTVALELLQAQSAVPDVVEKLNAVVAAARKTRDVRFIDIATWFAQSVEAAVVDTTARPSRSGDGVDEMRTNGRVGLEVFVPRRVGAVNVDVPFVLSPHWRY